MVRYSSPQVSENVDPAASWEAGFRWRRTNRRCCQGPHVTAVPIETFVQASRGSMGCGLKRAAREIGMAMRPSAGRPPFSEIDVASWVM